VEFRGRELAPQHVRVIERASARFATDPNVVALLVGGSVAHGYALPSSDVDVVLVVEEASGPPTFSDDAIADYEGGYLDGKIVTRDFLVEVAERGSEPARWAFQDAIVAFSHDPKLPPLVESIPRYPEETRDGKLRTFLGYLLLHVWFASEADKRDDRYLAGYAANRLSLFAGRAVLAWNRRLYPFHKWFMRELERAPEKPEGLLDRIDLVLREPRTANAKALADSVFAFCGIEVPVREAADDFVRHTEWAWRSGNAAPEDW
jgi:hypothetical protein